MRAAVWTPCLVVRVTPTPVGHYHLQRSEVKGQRSTLHLCMILECLQVRMNPRRPLIPLPLLPSHLIVEEAVAVWALRAGGEL